MTGYGWFGVERQRLGPHLARVAGAGVDQRSRVDGGRVVEVKLSSAAAQGSIRSIGRVNQHYAAGKAPSPRPRKLIERDLARCTLREASGPASAEPRRLHGAGRLLIPSVGQETSSGEQLP